MVQTKKCKEEVTNQELEDAAIKHGAIPEEGPNEVNGDKVDSFKAGADWREKQLIKVITMLRSDVKRYEIMLLNTWTDQDMITYSRYKPTSDKSDVELLEDYKKSKK